MEIAKLSKADGLPTVNEDGSPHVTAVGPGIAAPFNAPSQGPPPWNAYRVEPRSAI
jgi:hypothetical protein